MVSEFQILWRSPYSQLYLNCPRSVLKYHHSCIIQLPPIQFVWHPGFYLGNLQHTSPNGWTTDAIGVTWLLRRFIPATDGRKQGRYRLLILDGYSSHLTPYFDQICTQNNIIPLCMPAHSSYLLQPLDIGCLSVLKRKYSKLVKEYIRTGSTISPS